VIKIAVSACLLGQNVRYDGGSKTIPFIVDELAKQFQIIPVCPESEAGLGTPRPPMHLVQQRERVNAVLVDSPKTNLTQTIQNHAEQWWQKNKDIAGLIIKARSPSCAFKTASLVDKNEYVSGLFTADIQKHLANHCIIDEIALADVLKLNIFLHNVTES
jgi:uncharacterized protein YbbK (DUF523 family)